MSYFKRAAVFAAFGLSMVINVAEALPVKVTVTNNAPSDGTYFTPLWVGFHDGTFDAFNSGETATTGISTIAELGNPAPLSGEFTGFGLDGVIGGGPLAPGSSVSGFFNLATDGSHDFLSYASMLLPSSDFFIGNDNAASIASVLGGLGELVITVFQVYDAGSEINDFTTSAANGLFPGIGLPASTATDGVDENGVITPVSGTAFAAFLNVGSADVSGLNFDNYQSIATIRIASVPLPATLSLLLAGVAGLGLTRRRFVAAKS